MQSRDGGWGAFDVDNSRALVRELPFCDFGEVIDPPSADVTAHALEMLAALGRGGDGPARRGLDWLLAEQEADGSWFGRWGVNHVYGTGAAVPALVAAGVPPTAEPVRRAVAWLDRRQNDDGGWGEDLRSYDDPAWVGRGASTASQTAWALLALDAAGERGSAARRGVDWLVETQRPTAAGTSRSSPAPASPRTSTSTTTSTGWSFRSWRWGGASDERGGKRRGAAARRPSAETMAKAREENFPVAAVFLGRRRRRLLMAIYGFARLVDDIGDEAAGDRAALLDWAGRSWTRLRR